MRFDRRLLSLVGGILLGVPLLIPSTRAQAAEGTGTVVVTVAAPQGVPANALLVGSTPTSGRADEHAVNITAVAGKPPAGTSSAVSLTMPAGAYKVTLPDVQWDGVRYIGTGSRPEVPVISGATRSLDVTYAEDGGARQLRLTERTATSVNLAWDGPAGAEYQLRRATGPTPPGKPTDGQAVSIQGTMASDPGLTPGATYSYALFTRRKGPWAGPLTMTSSLTPTDPAQASYIPAPTTVLASAADVVATRVLTDGLEATFAANARIPLLGAAVVLPILPDLDGGYLGTAVQLSADGRTVKLAPDGLAAAFDYYEVDVKDLSTPPVAPLAPVTPGTGAGATPSTPPGKKPADPAQWPAYRAARSKKVTPPAKTVGPGKAAAMSTMADTASLAASAAPEGKCGKVTVPDADFADLRVTVGASGHFATKVNKWGPVPKSATVDLDFRVDATAAADAKVAAAYKCKRDLPPIMRPISWSPVPISYKLELGAEVSISGAVELSNVGVTGTLGFDAHASMSPKGISATGGPFFSAAPLTPSVTAGSVELAAKLGSALTIGPGVGSKEVGAIAGVRGELSPVDATATIKKAVGEPACVSVKAGPSYDLLLTARAWLGPWSGSADFSFAKGHPNFPGSPWDHPKGCSTAPPPAVPEDVIGPGVTKQSDKVVGVPGQQGYSDGLIPGQKTWVLSTGLLSQVGLSHL
jgi:hypothetical protein